MGTPALRRLIVPMNNGKSSAWSVINPAANDSLDLHVKKSGGEDPSTKNQLEVVTMRQFGGNRFTPATSGGHHAGPPHPQLD